MRKTAKKNPVPGPAKKRNKERNGFFVEPKTDGQKDYIDSILNNDLTICDGSPGTGKTVLAVGMALKLLQSHEEYKKIIIVRPALEADGEKLGYLPGGISDKMRPLVQPIVDALRVFISDEGYLNTLLPSDSHTSIIEIRTLAFMRGTNFHDCVVIFDEAQNSTPGQMKLFLTRIGRNCKVIVEGDVEQSDIHGDNGLEDAMDRLENVEGIGLIELGHKDIVRSYLVSKIMKRYGKD